MTALSDGEIAAALAELPHWAREGALIHRSVKCPTFLDGIEAVRRVAVLAEAADHHPDIEIRWRTVRFALTTWSAGGITRQDIDLAREIDLAVSEQLS